MDMTTKSNALLALQAYGKVKRLAAEMAIQSFKTVGLGPLQARLVLDLGAQGTASLADLSRDLASDPAAIGRAADTLLKKGLARRVDHPSDRRRWQVSLTPKGRTLLARVEARYAAIAEAFCAPLSRAELAVLLKLLTKIGSGLEAQALRKGRP